MRLLAIDPGPKLSSWCYFEENYFTAGTYENEQTLKQLEVFSPASELVLENISSYGMPVGAEVFETCIWIGRFIQAWNRPYRLIYRRDVKMHLCGSMRAKDSNIRQAMIDRFGEPGTKKEKGKTYGLKKDEWQALALAVVAFDLKQTLETKPCQAV